MGNSTTYRTFEKADILKRTLALMIDLGIAVLIASIFGYVPIIGSLLSAAYMLARDGIEYGILDRRSLGKRIMRLRTVRIDGTPMTLEMSIRRNVIFISGVLIEMLSFIPFIRWLLVPVVGLASATVVIIEIVSILTSADGRRWGDKIAGTKVIEVSK